MNHLLIKKKKLHFPWRLSSSTDEGHEIWLKAPQSRPVRRAVSRPWVLFPFHCQLLLTTRADLQAQHAFNNLKLACKRWFVNVKTINSYFITHCKDLLLCNYIPWNMITAIYTVIDDWLTVYSPVMSAS